MREAGTNSFRYINGGSDGSINGLKGNFDASTDYEWHTKAWCTGNVDANGDSDPQYHSGWGNSMSSQLKIFAIRCQPIFILQQIIIKT